MDRLLRTYAHTAWTAADPLAGLEPHVRRAILTMPSTWRERLKMGPWSNRLQRRDQMRDILAERRLAYELALGSLAPVALPPNPETPLAVGTINSRPIEPPHRPLTPYYVQRLSAHHAALGSLNAERTADNASLLEHSPEAQSEAARRQAIRRSLAIISQQREQLDILERSLTGGQPHGETTTELGVKPSRTIKRNRSPSR